MNTFESEESHSQRKLLVNSRISTGHPIVVSCILLFTRHGSTMTHIGVTAVVIATAVLLLWGAHRARDQSDHWKYMMQQVIWVGYAVSVALCLFYWFFYLFSF